MGDSEETLLLALLNSTPVVGSRPVDELADEAAAAGWLRAWGGRGTGAELAAARAARADLQAVVRGQRPVQVLGTHLAGVVWIPVIEEGRLVRHLEARDDDRLAARAVLAYFACAEQAPGRLRACGNDACRLFLLDHSRAGTARWCSMATCGNRMKARRHATRARSTR